MIAMLPKFFQSEYLNNQVVDYLIALGILVGGIFILKILQTFILRRLKRWTKRTATRLDDALVRIFEGTLIPVLYLGTFYLAIANLTLHPILKQTIDVLAVMIGTILGIRFFISLAEYFLRIYGITHQTGHPELEQSINSLIPAIRTAVWAIGLIFLLDNLGFDISAVVATLGIGGVAIALASQGILQDLFSYFSILFDRPFELGDFIIVGDFIGTVEHVGIKTTRLKSLSGEGIVMANTDLTSSRIRNFKQMEKRRIAFKIGVTYETPLEKLETIPSMLKTIVEETENVIFDRAHFSSYGDFSLDFEVVYFVTSNDYNQYMDAQQKINFKLKRIFKEHSIEFAYPTQLTYFHRSEPEKSLDQFEVSSSENMTHL